MIRLHARRSPCEPAEAERALAALDHREGIYFATEAGVPGLHPLQGTLVAQPALRMAVFEDGVEVRALTAFGQALLRKQPLAAWRSATGRGTGAAVLEQVRGFLACFEAAADVLLLGAFRFEAHRLRFDRGRQAGGNADAMELGVLYFPERLLHRDAEGSWSEVVLSLDGQQAGSTPVAVLNPADAVEADPTDDYPPGGYAGMVRRAVALLRERPLVSLTLSQSYRRRVTLSPAQAFARLRAANPAPATFFLNDGSGLRLFGASPDLQLLIQDGEVQAMPVCGTVARRPGAQGEADSLRELFNEEVDAASLAVCSDALRNDLAPLCEPGSLRLLDRRRPMSLATVVHAVDRVAGRLRAGCDAWDAIAATAAPVMLTGTPRDEALRAIAELEASPRGWYGGMVVLVGSDGAARVGTLLRAAAVRGDVAEVRTGGDLLADSSPGREEDESRLKTRSLWRAFGLEAAAGAAGPGQAASSRAPTSAVQLQARGDPFGDGLADALAAAGVRIDVAAPVTVWAGAGPAPPAPRVAIGDAAYRLLRDGGAAVEPCAAEHGRVVYGATAAGQAFTAGRYATWRLAAPPAGWEVLAQDEAGAPLALRRDSTACILFRPDSLLAGDPAREILRDAIARVQADSG